MYIIITNTDNVHLYALIQTQDCIYLCVRMVSAGNISVITIDLRNGFYERTKISIRLVDVLLRFYFQSPCW